MTTVRTASLICVVLLAGCNADERARPISLEKGSYRGAADTELSDATRQNLAKRTALQRFEGALAQPLRPSEAPATSATAIEGRVAGQRF